MNEIATKVWDSGRITFPSFAYATIGLLLRLFSFIQKTVGGLSIFFLFTPNQVALSLFHRRMRKHKLNR